MSNGKCSLTKRKKNKQIDIKYLKFKNQKQGKKWMLLFCEYELSYVEIQLRFVLCDSIIYVRVRIHIQVSFMAIYFSNIHVPIFKT